MWWWCNGLGGWGGFLVAVGLRKDFSIDASAKRARFGETRPWHVLVCRATHLG
jgi:hypothetical protein